MHGALAVRDVQLPDPAPNQILVETEASAVSAGTELAVYTGTHQWLQDPNLPDWKFPFRSGYSAAGTVVAVGAKVPDLKPGDRVSYPGNHASAGSQFHLAKGTWRPLDAATNLNGPGAPILAVSLPTASPSDPEYVSAYLFSAPRG